MARILLIDDDEQVRNMLRMRLSRAGHEVIEAGDGREALEKFRAEPTELIITDIVMPEKEGLEVIMEICRDYPKVNVIAISGGGRIDASSYLDMATKFGAKHVFSKPVDWEKLQKAIDELLAASG